MDVSSDRLDRLRFENIERRRQLCSDVVKGRKHKLSELYFLCRSPLIPISDEIIASEDDNLMAFLEKNDLESGHLFDESSLPPPAYTAKVRKVDGTNTVRESLSKEQVPATEACSVATVKISESVNDTQNAINVSSAVEESKVEEVNTNNKTDVKTDTENYDNNVTKEMGSQQQLVEQEPTTQKNIRPIQKPPPTPTERMTTRVSSGALRHKSVNEILGNIPKGSSTAITSTKRRSAPSGGEIIAQTRPKAIAPSVALEEPPVKPSIPLVKIFYSIQASPLTNLVPTAHKSLTTENFLTSYMEARLMMTFARIDELKREGKWSLRQPQRFRAPKRTKAHWDYLQAEMQWVADDYNKERRRKKESCAHIAEWIKEYWTYGKSVCITPKSLRLLTDVEISERLNARSDTAAREVEVEAEGKNQYLTPAVDRGIRYGNGRGRYHNAHYPIVDPFLDDIYRDSIEDLPIVPINKFAMVTTTASPERYIAWRRQREAEAVNAQRVAQSQAAINTNGSGHKPMFISETARRGVYIKAPSPPSMKYVEFGVPTIWLPQDDANLLKLASEFMYNWDVIAANMNSRQSWGVNSNIERRTPWECFERWMQLEPNFQLQDLRGPYARAAQIWIEATSRAQVATKRRLVPMGISPDTTQRGQRRLRWTGMFEAIKKSLRKRENSARPGSTPIVKKPTSSGTNTPKGKVPTPMELIKLKAERDKAISEAILTQQIALMREQNGGRTPAGGTPTGNSVATASGSGVSSSNNVSSSVGHLPQGFSASNMHAHQAQLAHAQQLQRVQQAQHSQQVQHLQRVQQALQAQQLQQVQQLQQAQHGAQHQQHGQHINHPQHVPQTHQT
ncbi:hypothetical protein V1511DRAFT_496745 [Dipodascopsis uninucleata]